MVLAALTGSIVSSINRPSLLNLNTPPSASITDIKQLSSYNWIEGPKPTIAVPGIPPLWTAPSRPRQLRKDSGLVYIAQNAARHPDSPLEPLFRSLYLADPDFNIREIDVVTDRNNIRKLLSFVNGGADSKHGLEAFTIKVEITKNTAVFSREETVTQEFIGPSDFRGYGHEFEKSYTTSGIKGGTGHHRIISYQLGDLKFIIRHETDGYVGTSPDMSSSSKEPDSDDLSRMLGSLSLSALSKSLSTTPSSHESKLLIKEEGRVVQLSSTIEIKTRVSHKPLSIQEVAPQLWISQTPKLIRAYHQRGMFQIPEVEDVTARIKRWEEDNQKYLRRLAALIMKIVEVVKRCGGRGVVRYDEKGDKLVIWTVERQEWKRMLPEDLYSKWDDEDDSSKGRMA